MEGMTYLAVAYLGMLVAIALWTWTSSSEVAALTSASTLSEGVVGVMTNPKIRR